MHMVIINYDDHQDSHRTYPASAAQLILTGSLECCSSVSSADLLPKLTRVYHHDHDNESTSIRQKRLS